MSHSLAYLKGELVPADQAVLPVHDAGIVLGATVTENVRTFGHRLFRLEAHLQRLGRSLAAVGFETGLTRQDFTELCETLVTHNSQSLHEDDDLGLVVFVTAGSYPTYAGEVIGTCEDQPTVCIHTFALPFEKWDSGQESGVHLVTPSTCHLPPRCCDPGIKSRSRMHYYLADRQARLVDPGASALLLDLDGNITETSTANFLIVADGQVVSPTERNILPGISRAVVAELCEELGISFVERDLQLHDVVQAEEAFVTSTPYCLTSVTRINGDSIGDGEPGPVADRLLTAWNKLVGVDIRQQVRTGASRRRASVTVATP